MKTITSGRVLAIAVACAFAYGTLTLLLQDQLWNAEKWAEPGFQQVILTVIGTIAAGYFVHEAKRAKDWLSMVGFALLFVAGTALVVFNSVGRQAESSMLTVAQSEDAAERRVALKASLKSYNAMLDKTTKKLHKDCVVGKRGKGHCNGLRKSIGVYQSAIHGDEVKLKAIGPVKPAHAKATQGAKIASLFGADEAKAKAAMLLLEPFLWTLFFEIGSIVSSGFAFRREPAAANDNMPVLGAGNAGRTPAAITERPEGEITQDEIDELVRVIKGNPGIGNGFLAEKLCVSKGEASKRATRAVELGLVNRYRNGREVELIAA